MTDPTEFLTRCIAALEALKPRAGEITWGYLRQNAAYLEVSFDMPNLDPVEWILDPGGHEEPPASAEEPTV